MSAEVLLEASHIGKRYPGQVALEDVTFRVRRGAVNVLIGENGAGKSTLMRILAGVETADTGELRMDGRTLVLRSPRDAAAQGISIVHQELALLPNLDIAENIFAGRELVRSAVLVDRLREDARSDAAMRQLRKPMAAETGVAALSLGSRQVVELARAMAHGARVVILDEPTSALSGAETESLFAVMADMKQRGVTVIYISHRLHELLRLGDWFTVLRGGRVVGEAARAEVDRRWIVERMSGRAEREPEARRGRSGATAAALVVRGLSVAAEEGEPGIAPGQIAPVQDVSLSLARGEILGIYGLLGSGRTELLEALAGARSSAGEVQIDGRAVRLLSVRNAVEAGIVLVPEDRQRDGLAPDLSIRENVALGVGGMWISRRRETARVRALAQEMNLAARDLELPVTTLSGGNQQKVLLARCLMANPKVLLLDEPTRGVDVGAKAEIYRILKRLAEGGLSIVFASSEIEETRELADRVLVLRQGCVAAEFAQDELSDEVLFAAASPGAATGAAAGPRVAASPGVAASPEEGG